MSTLYGSEYEEEVDAIYELAVQHIRKYGEQDLHGTLDRLFGALRYAIANELEKTK